MGQEHFPLELRELVSTEDVSIIFKVNSFYLHQQHQNATLFFGNQYYETFLLVIFGALQSRFYFWYTQSLDKWRVVVRTFCTWQQVVGRGHISISSVPELPFAYSSISSEWKDAVLPAGGGRGHASIFFLFLHCHSFFCSSSSSIFSLSSLLVSFFPMLSER